MRKLLNDKNQKWKWQEQEVPAIDKIEDENVYDLWTGME